MPKAKKTKAPKKIKSKEPEQPVLPSLVEGLAKLVERLEIVERKVDQINSRISNVLFEIRDDLRQNTRQNASHQQNPFGYTPQPKPLPQRQLYQAVCADCRRSCEVPFNPNGRPVYCKECFALRKSGAPVLSTSSAQPVVSQPEKTKAKAKKKK